MSMHNIRQLFFATIFIFSIVVATFASTIGTDDSRRILTSSFESTLMAKPMPYSVIVPEGYKLSKNKDKKYPVVYLLHGLWGRHDNWIKRAKLTKYSSAYDYIIVMPEGNNGWYTDSRSVKNQNYESYILKELIPEIETKFRAKNGRENRAIAGLSMGGFGALKFGIKYPEKFVLAGSFSGAIGAAGIKLEAVKGRKVLHDSLKIAFGEMDSPHRKKNDLYNLIESKTSAEINSLPFIYLDCGTQDFLIADNRKFSKLLFEKRVAHEFRQLPGAHNWRFWDSQIQEFLRLSKKFLK